MAARDTGETHEQWQEAARIMPPSSQSPEEQAESLKKYRERVSDRWQKKTLGTYPRLRASVVDADKSVVIIQKSDGQRKYSTGFILQDVQLPEVEDEGTETGRTS